VEHLLQGLYGVDVPGVILLFIITYSYVGVARNWSHKRQTSP